jgi:hypothetical protein
MHLTEMRSEGMKLVKLNQISARRCIYVMMLVSVRVPLKRIFGSTEWMSPALRDSTVCNLSLKFM